MSRVRELIDALGLVPHPERGFFAETYRASSEVLAQPAGLRRAASTAIYFLVTADQPTTYMHRLRSDEVFHFYEGGSLEIIRCFADGRADVVRLGLDLARGERPQIVIPAGTWFGTELAAEASHCLVGCTVAPGFDFADFELLEQGPELERLRREQPGLASRLAKMARTSAR